MTFGSVAAMNSFDFFKRWKYFGESPAMVSLDANIYPAFPSTPQPDMTSSKNKQVKVVITSLLKTEKMKGGRA
jgi:hypothetical protein